MNKVEKYRNLIGAIETITGSFLILPIIVIIILVFSGLYPLSYIVEFLSMFDLHYHDFSLLCALLIGFSFIGLVILLNGIWKIRSNRYLKNTKL